MDVVSLSEVGLDDVQFVGGKAANLGELIRAGYRVPGGFVVTTDAYAAATDQVQDRLTDLIPAAGADPSEFEHAATDIAGLFETVQFPDGLAEQLRSALTGLTDKAVAVRSSATAEDLGDASFAGQQDTELNVGAEAVSDAVRRCWGSLWTARAMAYRAERDIAPSQVRLAVVIRRWSRPTRPG